jgi:hypothetical protein
MRSFDIDTKYKSMTKVFSFKVIFNLLKRIITKNNLVLDHLFHSASARQSGHYIISASMNNVNEQSC